jgi:hypothetical protein
MMTASEVERQSEAHEDHEDHPERSEHDGPREHGDHGRDAHGHEHGHHGHHGRWAFARHYLEMVVAMFVGMAVLGGLVHGALALAGTEMPDQPEVTALTMAFYMAAGMVVWMRHRGHAWAGTLEMSGAMFVPALALFPALWAGAISGDDLLMLEHVAMLPLMYVVMLRRRHEYGG